LTATEAEAPPFGAGVHNIPEEDYFGATYALSCSGAKLLLPPSCPAKFFWRQDHPQHKKVWDFGSGAHKLVLGAGPDIVEVKAPNGAAYDNWMTKDAKQQRDDARAAGKTPLLTKELAVARGMARALEAAPMAWNLLDPEHGQAEQSLFWQHPRTGIWLRCRVDWMYDAGGGQLIIVDYKTCESADPDSIAKACANFGYHMQNPWYVDGLTAVTGADVSFWNIFQEKAAPYLVNVIELIPDAVRVGRVRNERAIDIYRECTAAGEWPGYDGDVTEIALPAWASRAEDYS
jgi:hypothetical protein